jgi:hypothetical protein
LPRGVDANQIADDIHHDQQNQVAVSGVNRPDLGWVVPQPRLDPVGRNQSGELLVVGFDPQWGFQIPVDAGNDLRSSE